MIQLQFLSINSCDGKAQSHYDKNILFRSKICRKYFIIFRNEKYPKPENSLIHKRRKIFEYEFFSKPVFKICSRRHFSHPHKTIWRHTSNKKTLALPFVLLLFFSLLPEVASKKCNKGRKEKVNRRAEKKTGSNRQMWRTTTLSVEKKRGAELWLKKLVYA